MRNLKLEDRISLNYVLLFLVLILFSNVILVYSLQRQSKKNLVSLAQNKIEDINSFLDKVTVFSRKTNELTFDFNPQVMEGGKIIYLKPFNPGEEGYLYVLEMKRNNSSAIPINTIGGTDTEEASATNEEIVKMLEKFNLRENEANGKTIDLGSENKYFAFKVARNITYKFY